MFADEAVKGAQHAGVDKVYLVGATELPDGVRPFSDLVAKPSGPVFVRARPLTPRSSSTRRGPRNPKGAELTHFQLYMNSDIPGRIFGCRTTTSWLSPSPSFTSSGCRAS